MSREFLKGVRLGIWLPMLLAGAAFLYVSFAGTFVMDAETYGDLVISIPAEVWSSVLFFSATFYIVFLFINGRLWWSWIVRIVSSFFGAGKLILFAVSAVQSAGHDIVILFGGAWALCILGTVFIDAREAVLAGGRVSGYRN